MHSLWKRAMMACVAEGSGSLSEHPVYVHRQSVAGTLVQTLLQKGAAHTSLLHAHVTAVVAVSVVCCGYGGGRVCGAPDVRMQNK